MIPVPQPTPAESLMLKQLLEARALYIDGIAKLSSMEPNSELLQAVLRGGIPHLQPTTVIPPVPTPSSSLLGAGVEKEQQNMGYIPLSQPSANFSPAPTPSSPFLGSAEQEQKATHGLDLLRAVSLAQENTSPLVKIPKQEEPELTTTPTMSPKYQVKTDSEGRQYVTNITDLDILCGRGGKSNHHPGNKKYRQVVDEIKGMYRRTATKTVKTDLSRAIVDHVQTYGGRFVKKDEKSGHYHLLSKCEARKKTSQALRETKALKWTL